MTNADLEAAAALAAAGVPVFCAYPDPGEQTGYRLPGGWQNTRPDPGYLQAWHEGMAICAVTGCGVDLIDVDPRNGGDLLTVAPYLTGLTIVGTAQSPSGGLHLFIASLGVGSRDGVLPGIDIKAGDEDGAGRGFAFIAPTIRISKTTGQPVAYQWTRPPDTTRINGHRASDSKLAALVREARGSSGRAFTEPDSGERKHAGPIPYGEHHSRLVGYAGWLRSMAIPLRPEAETLMTRRLDDLVQPPDATRPVYTRDEALAELHDIYARYPAGDPAAEQHDSDGTAAGDELPEINLGELAAQGRPERPDLICGMLYPAAVHCLAGPPGGGKTTLVAFWMLEHIRAGGHVMLLDEESGISQTVLKFLDLGAQPGELVPPRLTYVPFPSRTWTPSDIARLHQLIGERRPGIITWDSVAAFLAIAGADENSAIDVTRFWQKILVPCAREFGAAVLGVDHLTKSGEHGGYSRGSGAKKAASDVQFIIETVKPFSRHSDGMLRMTTSPGKDRSGWLEVAYDIRVRKGPPVTLEISAAPLLPATGDVTWKRAKTRLWQALCATGSPAQPATISQMVDWVVAEFGGPGLRRQTCSTYLNEFADAGLADCVAIPGQRDKGWWPLAEISDGQPDAED